MFIYGMATLKYDNLSLTWITKLNFIFMPCHSFYISYFFVSLGLWLLIFKVFLKLLPSCIYCAFHAAHNINDICRFSTASEMHETIHFKLPARFLKLFIGRLSVR